MDALASLTALPMDAPVKTHKRRVPSHRPSIAEIKRKEYEKRNVPESKREPEPWLTEYQKALNLAPTRPIGKLDIGQKKMLRHKLGAVKFASYIKLTVKDEERKKIVKEAESYINADDAQGALWRYRYKLLRLATRQTNMQGIQFYVPSRRKDVPEEGYTVEILPFNTTVYDDMNMDLPMCLPWNETDLDSTPEWSIWDYLNTSPKTHSPFTFQVIDWPLFGHQLEPDEEDHLTLRNAGFEFSSSKY